MTIQAGEHQFMALHEADLRTGEPLLLSSLKGEQTFNVASKPAQLEPGYVSAWRCMGKHRERWLIRICLNC